MEHPHFAGTPFAAYSTDERVRYAATSGGVVSSLVRHLLSTGRVTAALSFEQPKPLDYTPVLIRSWDEYRQAGSIYQEVQILPFLKTQEYRAGDVLLLTCLPCQARAARRILTLKNVDSIIISLTCSSQLTPEATAFLLQKLGIQPGDVHTFRYRGNGWPSGVAIGTETGQTTVPNFPSVWSEIFHSEIFSLRRCRSCSDTFGVGADITVADPWLPRYLDSETRGVTLVAAQSDVGSEVLASAVANGVVATIEDLSVEEFVRAQRTTLIKKHVRRRHPRLFKALHLLIRTPFYKNVIFTRYYAAHTRAMRALYTRLAKGDRTAKFKQRVLIINQHTNNHGDEAAGKSLVRRLLREAWVEQVRVMYINPGRIPEARFCDGLSDRIVNMEATPARMGERGPLSVLGRARFLLTANLLQYRVPRRILRPFFWDQLSVVHQIRKADIVISAPSGPNVGSIYYDWTYLWRIYTAFRCRRTTAIFCPSVGPFPMNDAFFMRIARYCFRHASSLAVRDAASVQFLDEIGVSGGKGADAAFLTRPDTRDLPVELSFLGRTSYAVFVPNELYAWHARFRNICAHELDGLYVRILQWLVDAGFTVVMLPQLFASRNDSRYFLRLIRLAGRKELVLVDPNYDSDVQQAIISRARLVVGARYHSIVFAIAAARPFVALCYEHKMSGMLKSLGLSEQGIDLRPDVPMDAEFWDEVRSLLQRTHEREKAVSRHTAEASVLATGAVERAYERMICAMGDPAVPAPRRDCVGPGVLGEAGNECPKSAS